jgi:hypothetical protein
MTIRLGDLLDRMKLRRHAGYVEASVHRGGMWFKAYAHDGPHAISHLIHLTKISGRNPRRRNDKDPVERLV